MSHARTGPYVVGLTGGIASGKSAVAERLSDFSVNGRDYAASPEPVVA